MSGSIVPLSPSSPQRTQADGMASPSASMQPESRPESIGESVQSSAERLHVRIALKCLTGRSVAPMLCDVCLPLQGGQGYSCREEVSKPPIQDGQLTFSEVRSSQK